MSLSSYPPHSYSNPPPPSTHFEDHPSNRLTNSAAYWQAKRRQWREESSQRDAFSQGGLFNGLGQHSSPSPLPPPPSFYPLHDRAAPRSQTLFPPITRPSYQPAAPSYSPLPSHPPSHPPYLSALHELTGGLAPSEQAAKREAALAYQSILQAQMREKDERLKREKKEREDRERREEEEARHYNPFGRGGGGAPMRDGEGHILANRKAALAQATSPPPVARTVQGGRGGRVGWRSDEATMEEVRKEERSEWQKSLAAQIEEKKAKQRMREEREKEEERKEEERIKRERERLDSDYQHEKEKERERIRKKEEEEEEGRRRKRGEKGKEPMTDYEREQQMKGRIRQQREEPREERKEMMEPTGASQWANLIGGGGGGGGGRGGGGERRNMGPSVYDEMEREMDRLRAEIAAETARIRKAKAARKEQQEAEAARQQQTLNMKMQRRRHIGSSNEDQQLAHFLSQNDAHYSTPRHDIPEEMIAEQLHIQQEPALRGESTFIEGIPDSRPQTAQHSLRQPAPFNAALTVLSDDRPIRPAKAAVKEEVKESFIKSATPRSPPVPVMEEVGEESEWREESEKDEYGSEDFVDEGRNEESLMMSESRVAMSDTDVRDEIVEEFVVRGGNDAG